MTGFRDLIGPGRFIDPAVIQASAARGDDWYPYAAKMPLTPEATSQPRGDKTTFILHTQSGPHLTTLEALVAYLNRTDITGECTWILDFDGRCAQLVPVDTRADNNYLANPFATSVETQDVGYIADPGIAKTPWSDWQLAQLAGLSAWQVLNPRVHVPLRRADQGWNCGGIDGHRRYAEWSKYVGKTCPGEARWNQIPDVIAAAREIVNWTPDEEDDMTKRRFYLAFQSDDPSTPAREDYHLRCAAHGSNLASVIRSSTGAYQLLKQRFDTASIPVDVEYVNPQTGTVIGSWAEIPKLTAAQLDLDIGQVDPALQT